MRARTSLLLTTTAAFLALAGGIGCSLSAPDAPAKPKLDGDAHFTLLQTTDLHHHANGADHVGMDADPGTVGSYARIAAYVNFVRASAGQPVVLVDSGDWTMGTFYDLTLGQQPTALYFMDALRYDCVTVGNHEFDYTPKGLAQILGTAQTAFNFHTPIVASNLELNGDKDLAPYVGTGKAIQPTRVEVLPNGLKIGYIGLMGRDAAASAPASAPVTFTSFATSFAPVQAMVDSLRNDQGCHVVVALSHSGTDATGTAGEDVDLARHVTGIDVIASGHTHFPLGTSHAVANGGWTTQIVGAGAFGTHVSRIDLTYHADTKSTSLDAFAHPAMTDAGLDAVQSGLVADPAYRFITGSTDQQLNAGLGAFFHSVFPDYDAANLATGIYHPVGGATQDMVSNEQNPVLCPNGLGNLSADAVRAVPNALILQTLTAVGYDPANWPAGFDPTPFQAGVVASGVLRGSLRAGVPLSFADVYNVLPLGISPDASQALPVGYPLVSAYLDPADVKKLCALQLVAQTNLAPGQYYLNLSGLSYTLKPTESYAYFKASTAAAVLSVTSRKAAAGSTSAMSALGALSTLGTDSGAALLAAYGGGNPYAAAMVKLNDAAPDGGQIAVNLGTLGQVATLAAQDAATGGTSLSAALVAKALAAVDYVSGFTPTDTTCVGATTPISAYARVRVAADLYAVLMLGAAEAQFGVKITPFQSASSPKVLSTSDMAAILGNRVDADPATAGVQELKEWMALLGYVGNFPSHIIGPDYASTANFAQFGSFGNAVKVRNASYPFADIAGLMTTLGGLQAAP